MVVNRNIQEIDVIMKELLSDYKESPVDLLGIGDAERECAYIERCMNTYVRTVCDINNLFPQEKGSKRVLEIGCFLGIVSIALSRIGFNVTATDVPEYISCANLQKKFKDNGLSYVGCNLRDYKLPFRNEEFDIVIMCETLEHLNFNPLPVIKEINRVLKLYGLLYVTVPNIAGLENRLKLIKGESIHNTLDDLFLQLDARRNAMLGLHWREYARNEIKEMLERMDFIVIKQEYEKDHVTDGIGGFKGFVGKVVRYFLHIERIRRLVIANLFDPQIDPDLVRTMITFASKSGNCTKEFYTRDAALPK